VIMQRKERGLCFAPVFNKLSASIALAIAYGCGIFVAIHSTVIASSE